jgi:DNA-directed RNA polymerase III subunit RPC4
VEIPAPKPVAPQPSDTGKGKGRGRGRGRGANVAEAGRGRGNAPEMVPAGPFALGPLAAGMSGVSRPSSYIGASGSGKSGGASNAGRTKVESTVVLPRNRDQLAVDDAPEVYSDDDEFDTGVVDLEEVKLLDAMAPDALKKEKRKDRKQSTKGPKVKKEPVDVDADIEILSKGMVTKFVILRTKLSICI